MPEAISMYVRGLSRQFLHILRSRLLYIRIRQERELRATTRAVLQVILRGKGVSINGLHGHPDRPSPELLSHGLNQKFLNG